MVLLILCCRLIRKVMLLLSKPSEICSDPVTIVCFILDGILDGIVLYQKTVRVDLFSEMWCFKNPFGHLLS